MVNTVRRVIRQRAKSRDRILFELTIFFSRLHAVTSALVAMGSFSRPYFRPRRCACGRDQNRKPILKITLTRAVISVAAAFGRGGRKERMANCARPRDVKCIECVITPRPLVAPVQRFRQDLGRARALFTMANIQAMHWHIGSSDRF